jgi:hypothetical protein
MPKFMKVATTDELEDQQAKLVEVEGQKTALFRVGQAFHALSASSSGRRSHETSREEARLHRGRGPGRALGRDDRRAGEPTADGRVSGARPPVRLLGSSLFGTLRVAHRVKRVWSWVRFAKVWRIAHGPP